MGLANVNMVLTKMNRAVGGRNMVPVKVNLAIGYHKHGLDLHMTE